MTPLSHGLRRLATPAALLLGSLLLSQHIVRDSTMIASLPDPVGPTGWPRLMLGAVGLCALIWIGKELLALRRAAQRHMPVDEEYEGYAYGRAMIGLGLVVLYGIALPQLGFPIATLAFVALWCVIGGIRRPLTLALVTGIGCVVLLYVFVLLAQMPLNRGHGVFDDFTVALYRLLGIY
ncbi:tripartite tricarboxylate transporter TctB family protein [Azospirillum sp. Marseille-Q6669]